MWEITWLKSQWHHKLWYNNYNIPRLVDNSVSYENSLNLSIAFSLGYYISHELDITISLMYAPFSIDQDTLQLRYSDAEEIHQCTNVLFLYLGQQFFKTSFETRF